MLEEKTTREQWGSRLGFILAAAGSAIGLGNIWRFPTTAGDNGGGIFVLLYIGCVLVIGVPIMLAEFTIGRAAQTNAVGAFRKLAPGSPWFMVGGMGVFTGFLILSFYAVVGGWIIGYLVDSATGALFSFSGHEALDAHFKLAAQDPAFSISYLLIFLAFTVYIIYNGVGEGIERWSKILMPILLVLLLVVIARGLTMPNSFEGLKFLLVPNFDKVQPGTLAAALGQAFFSLSLGMGTMITYGSYLSRKQNLPGSAIEVAGLDTVIALLAGLAIFPALFSITPNLSEGMRGGTGLIFVAFPRIFVEMFGGNALLAQLFGSAFFLLVLIAALTSSISLLEVVTAYFVDERGWARKKAAVVMGGIVFLIGTPSAISNEAPQKTFEVLGMSFFNLIALISNEYMLPIGGLLISVFVAWRWGRAQAIEEARASGARFRLGKLWHFILRWLAPLLITQIIVLRIISDLSNNKIIEFSRPFIDSLQWTFTAVDAILLAGTFLGGIVCWMRNKPATAATE